MTEPVPAAFALQYVVLDGDPMRMSGYEQYDVDLPKETPEALIDAVKRLSDEFDGASCSFCAGSVGWGLHEHEGPYGDVTSSRFWFTTIVLRPAKTDLRLCEDCTTVLLDDVNPGDVEPPYLFNPGK